MQVRKPVAILSYVELKDLPRLLEAKKKSHLPKDTSVYVGSYGVNRTSADLIHGANSKYAPMFSITGDTAYWQKRNLSPADEAKVELHTPARFKGHVPDFNALASLSPTEVVAWGRELGMRYRDRLRAENAQGTHADTWQLDEILGEAAQSGTRAVTEQRFIRGVLQGISTGRAELGDKPQQGIVYAAQSAAALARSGSAPAKLLLEALKHAAFRVVGEEYPDFRGSPKAAASAYDTWQEYLRAAGRRLADLASKYVVGLTPGYRLGVGLGGNSAGLSKGQVDQWRNAYVDARKRSGVAGFAEFHFRYGNSNGSVMDAAVEAVARGVKK